MCGGAQGAIDAMQAAEQQEVGATELAQQRFVGQLAAHVIAADAADLVGELDKHTVCMICSMLTTSAHS